jgi:hypothetical protein
MPNRDQGATQSAAIVEQFYQLNGSILLPLVNLIQSASQAVWGAQSPRHVRVRSFGRGVASPGGSPSLPSARSGTTKTSRAT